MRTYFYLCLGFSSLVWGPLIDFFHRGRIERFQWTAIVVAIFIIYAVVFGDLRSETKSHWAFIEAGGGWLSGNGPYLLGKWIGSSVGIAIFSYLIPLAIFALVGLLKWISDAVDKEE